MWRFSRSGGASKGGEKKPMRQNENQARTESLRHRKENVSRRRVGGGGELHQSY